MFVVVMFAVRSRTDLELSHAILYEPTGATGHPDSFSPVLRKSRIRDLVIERLHSLKVYRGWWGAAAVFMASAVCTGSGVYGFGVFIEPLEDAFGWNRAQISASLSFAAIGNLLGPFLGGIVDRHGTRPVMAASLVLIAAGFALRPLMADLWQWYALSFMQYAGFAGAASPITGKLIGVWFHRRRGRVIGVTGMGNNFGGLVMPPMLGALLPLLSWEGAYVVLACVTACIAVFALLAIRDFPSREELGDELADAPAGGTHELAGVSLGEALASPRFYALTLSVVLGTFVYASIMPHVITHQTDNGASLGTASIILAAFAVFGMVGKFAMGFAAERISSRLALVADFAGMSGFLVAMTVFSDPRAAWAVIPVFGFFTGAFGSLFQLVVLDTFGVRSFGSIMGVITLAMVASFGGGPLLVGLTYDATGSYTLAFSIVAAMFAAGAVLVAAAGALPAPAAHRSAA